MNDTLIHDSMKSVNQVLAKNSEPSGAFNYWMWLAIIELGVIGFLLWKNKTKTKVTAKQNFKEESLKQEIDFKNIIDSSFNSVKLYDTLKVKCHPDRFPTEKDKNAVAVEIFQEITKNKTNIKRLLELKEEANQKLNINF